ncbi:MAG: transketolase C-terminal domain-containing protein [Patescibacteria group bacterium]
MRITFIKILKEAARKNKDIFLLTADLGTFFGDFIKDCPKQFIDVGIAESNMIGMAAGMALAKKNVYCYSIIPFLTMRPLEQIKVGLCAHNLNVKLLGAGGGFAYGLEGMTHHAIEDIAIMRSLPNMTVVAPGDLLEAKAIAKESVNYKGPLYIRFGQDKTPNIHKNSTKIKIGKGIILNKGNKIALIATGSMLSPAKIVCDNLTSQGISTTLISMHTVKPLDVNLIKKILRHKAIFTIEEHSIIGGLGSAVAETLLELNYKGLFKRIGLPDEYSCYKGNHDYLCKKYCLTPETIINKILKFNKKI